ncbi:MAG: YciI family protein [Gemmatimonadaceae bacterium]
MKYLCLIYREESAVMRLSADERMQMRHDYNQYTDDIKASGHHLGGAALQPVSSAATVRVRGGSVSTTDGPFAETKEQLGGYYLIEARDLDDAIQVAARIPGALTGSIEVRPIMEI